MTPLLSIDQVADMLGVHKDTVRNLPIAFTRVGRQRRYHPGIVAKYLEDHSSRPKVWADATSSESAA